MSTEDFYCFGIVACHWSSTRFANGLLTGVPKRMATCFVEIFSLLIDFGDLLISVFYSFFISLQNGGFTLRKIF